MTREEARETLISILRDVNSDEQDMSVSPESFNSAMLIAIDALQEPSIPPDVEDDLDEIDPKHLVHEKIEDDEIVEEAAKNMKDCTTCKYGFVDEQFGFPMCHHPLRFSEDCVDFNMHEEVEESEKATGIEEKKPPEGLEDAAEAYQQQVIEETKNHIHLSQHTYAEGFEDALHLIPDAFKAGVAYDRAKSLKVDLKKEIDSEWKKCNPIDEGMGVESAHIHIEAFDIIARHFAEWQYQKDREEFAKIKAKTWSEGYNEGLVKGAASQRVKLFEEGLNAIHQNNPSIIERTIAGVFVKYGMDRMKEEMLKDAVKGVLVDNIDGTQDICLYEKRFGQKVHIVILKEEEE